METIFTPGTLAVLAIVIALAAAWAHRPGATPTTPPSTGGGPTIPGPGPDDGTVTPPGQGPAGE